MQKGTRTSAIPLIVLALALCAGVNEANEQQAFATQQDVELDPTGGKMTARAGGKEGQGESRTIRQDVGSLQKEYTLCYHDGGGWEKAISVTYTTEDFIDDTIALVQDYVENQHGETIPVVRVFVNSKAPTATCDYAMGGDCEGAGMPKRMTGRLKDDHVIVATATGVQIGAYRIKLDHGAVCLP